MSNCSDIQTQKSLLRANMCLAKKALLPAYKRTASEDALRQLEATEAFKAAKTIFIYYSLPDEPFTHDFADKWIGKKTILMPSVRGKEMHLHKYAGKGSMKVGKFGISEPCGDIFTDYGKIDLALVPGVAFTTTGKRLGRGGGYYDRFFSKPQTLHIHKVGICFGCQIVPDLPVEPNDVTMDLVVFSRQRL